MSETQNNTDDARARDHLANERTYLAWLRTGISLMAFGVVIARLRYLIPVTGTTQDTILHTAQLGLGFTGFGIATVLAAAWRFRAVQLQLRQGRYRSSKLLILTLTAAVTGIGTLILLRLATE